MGLTSRIACLYVPALPLHALLRAAPELVGQPLAVLDGEGARARVLHAAPEAQGVTPGMSRAEALAVCPAVDLRPVSPALARSAEEALLELAQAFSPLYEQGDGEVLLEVGDLGQLYPSERALGEAMLAQARRLGIPGQLGFAGGALAARVLAHAAPSAWSGPGGADERALLGPLAIEALPLDLAQVTRLRRWGLRRVADLAALPRDQLTQRLGAVGMTLHRLACGEDRTPLRPTPPVDRVTESIDLEDPLDNLEPLFFVLRGLLDRLLTRLSLRSLGCERFTLRLALEPAGAALHEDRELTVSTPTRDVATLLELLRIDLSSRPPPAPVRGASVWTEPAALRPAQLGLFDASRPAPEKLATTLARLAALFGPERLGAPAVVDSYLEDQVQLLAFPEGPVGQVGPLPVLRQVRLAAHVMRPPVPAEVTVGPGGPVAVRGEPGGGRVLCFAGPYRVRIGFGQPVLRDYYDVELDTGLLWRIFQDQATASWFIEARYA